MSTSTERLSKSTQRTHRGGHYFTKFLITGELCSMQMIRSNGVMNEKPFNDCYVQHYL